MGDNSTYSKVIIPITIIDEDTYNEDNNNRQTNGSLNTLFINPYNMQLVSLNRHPLSLKDRVNVNAFTDNFYNLAVDNIIDYAISNTKDLVHSVLCEAFFDICQGIDMTAYGNIAERYLLNEDGTAKCMGIGAPYNKMRNIIMSYIKEFNNVNIYDLSNYIHNIVLMDVYRATINFIEENIIIPFGLRASKIESSIKSGEGVILEELYKRYIGDDMSILGNRIYAYATSILRDIFEIKMTSIIPELDHIGDTIVNMAQHLPTDLVKPEQSGYYKYIVEDVYNGTLANNNDDDEIEVLDPEDDMED